jgi:DNA-binding MarR family transcriptional regulator
MAIKKNIVREMEINLLRLMNKFNKLEKQPIAFSTGDLLSTTEVHTIDEIGKKEGKTVTELCGLFGVTKGAVSQIVGKLSRKGYVTKVRNENFGKEILLSLTPKGHKVFAAHIKMHNKIDEYLAQKSKDISSEQVKQFMDIMKRIENHVDLYLNLKG